MSTQLEEVREQSQDILEAALELIRTTPAYEYVKEDNDSTLAMAEFYLNEWNNGVRWI